MPGLIVYRFTAPLYYANANLFSEEIQKLVKQAPTPVKWFVLDGSAIRIGRRSRLFAGSGADSSYNALVSPLKFFEQ